MQKFNALLKKELTILLKQSGTYIAGFIYLFGTAFYYFIINGFFTYNQSVDLRYYFSSFPYIMIAFIPALSFNVFKKENIFETYAIKDIYKFAAKFVALYVIFAANTLFTLITPLMVLRFGSIEAGQLFTGYLMILLYGAMMISLSIMVQMVLENKIASLVVLIILLFVFNTIHVLPKYHLFKNGVFISLVKMISFSWHFENAMKGILDTSDVLFYIVFSILFLFISVIAYENRKGMKFLTLRNSLILIILILSLFDSNLFSKKIDLTANKEFSLTKQSKVMAKNLMNQVNITYACSSELKNIYPQINDIIDILFKYNELNNNINIYIENPDNNPDLKKKLNSLGIEAQQFSAENSYNSTLKGYYSAILIEDENSVKTIPFILSTNGLEYLLTSSLQSLQNNSQLSAILLCKNELSIENDYPYLIPFLTNSGIKVYNDFNLDEIEKIQTSIPLVLIGSAKLTRNECALIENELYKGRNLLILDNPYSVDIREGWKIISKSQELENMLACWGFNLSSELLLDNKCYEITFQGQENSSEYKKQKYPYWINTDQLLNFYWPVAIKMNPELNGKILVKTSKEGFLKKIDETKLYEIDTNPMAKNLFSSDYREIGEYALAVSATAEFPMLYKKGNSKLATVTIISDQYFPSFLMTYTNSLYNLNFVTDQILELNNASYLIHIKNKIIKDLSFTKIHSDEELKSCRIVTLLITLILIPLLTQILTLIITVTIRRNKKYETK